MEREVKELSDHVKKLEQSLAESRKENNNNSTVTDKQDSKVCVILWFFALHIFIYKYLFFEIFEFLRGSLSSGDICTIKQSFISCLHCILIYFWTLTNILTFHVFKFYTVVLHVESSHAFSEYFLDIEIIFVS